MTEIHNSLFVCDEAYCPSQQFFSHVGTEPKLLRFNQYCRELMCLAQGNNTVTHVGVEPRYTSVLRYLVV